eukprot:3671989-Karenia_brevis.AAC.1
MGLLPMEMGQTWGQRDLIKLAEIATLQIQTSMKSDTMRYTIILAQLVTQKSPTILETDILWMAFYRHKLEM